MPTGTSRTAEGADDPAPRAPELIWLRPERAGRGPVPAHSRAAIAAAAIALADAEGLTAVSMRRIAAALGAGTMSLYNYVPKKEQLFDLMLDAVAGEYDLPEESGVAAGAAPDPRASLTLLAGRQLAAVRRHPWVPALVLVRPSIGPNSLRSTEFFLAAMSGSPADGGTKMELFAMLNGFVCQFAEWERTTARATGDQWHTDLVAYLTAAVTTGRYPHLAAAMTQSAAQPLAPDVLFARSLDRLLTLILSA